jgi:hypothetical protein
MRLALDMAKMAKGGCLRAAIDETQQLIKKPCAEVPQVKKRSVQFPRHNKVKAVIERHSAMVCENQTLGYLPCPNGTGKNPYTLVAQIQGGTSTKTSATSARITTCGI